MPGSAALNLATLWRTGHDLPEAEKRALVITALDGAHIRELRAWRRLRARAGALFAHA